MSEIGRRVDLEPAENRIWLIPLEPTIVARTVPIIGESKLTDLTIMCIDRIALNVVTRDLPPRRVRIDDNGSRSRSERLGHACGLRFRRRAGRLRAWLRVAAHQRERSKYQAHRAVAHPVATF